MNNKLCELRVAIYLAGYNSIKEFCAETKINRSTIYNILNNKTNCPSGNVLFKISKALNISYTDAYNLCVKG